MRHENTYRVCKITSHKIPSQSQLLTGEEKKKKIFLYVTRKGMTEKNNPVKSKIITSNNNGLSCVCMYVCSSVS